MEIPDDRDAERMAKSLGNFKSPDSLASDFR